MPYWNPSKELRRKAEAKALAVSLYQPEGVTNGSSSKLRRKSSHTFLLIFRRPMNLWRGCQILPRSTAVSKEPSIGC